MKRILLMFVVATVLLAVRSSAITIPLDLLGGSADGGEETPPNASTGLGVEFGGGITYDDVANELRIKVKVENGANDLLGDTTAAHIHKAAIGVAGPVVFPLVLSPLGQDHATINDTLVLTAAQEADLLAGLYYVNIHTTLYSGGEIRGQIVGATGAVPDAGSTCLLLGTAFLTLFGLRRRIQL
ncbi:MAG: VPDSG-CTERM sorting domain-containing protein [Verrucomicrobia bacterium]|nr:VPDSG-CTERM sorting domain-containing protein [Verrucomicrobiota bacterium]